MNFSPTTYQADGTNEALRVAAGTALSHIPDEIEKELMELRRWKSTHAPRLDALEALLSATQREAAQGRESRDTLASERVANALLTEEVEQLRAALEAAVATERERRARICDQVWYTTTGHQAKQCANEIRTARPTRL